MTRVLSLATMTIALAVVDPPIAAREPAMAGVRLYYGPSKETAAVDLAIGRRIGAYRIERLLGRGGMGLVYAARRDDDAFERQVAIKLLPAWSAGALTERFAAERRVLAALEHPGIARLLDAGTTDAGGAAAHSSGGVARW